MVVTRALEEFVAEQFNADAPWSETAAAFITASGNVLQDGETAIFAAQQSETAETAAEISRLFLGVQIQCAQCHDHPTDRWTREQFHEFAAFFPRVSFRPQKNGDKRTFIVQGQDKAPRRRRANAQAASLEHRMPDLDDPSAPGETMTPAFFIGDERLDLGVPDAERRQAIADWITASDNEWFAKAFVNRVWSELIGWGFYPLVDDLGPDRDCAAPQTLNALADEFVASGYSVKHLMRTIARTEIYQRPEMWRYLPEEHYTAGGDPGRLSSEQLFNAVRIALDVPTPLGSEGRPARAAGPKREFTLTFGYDPSLSDDDVTSSIPQALLLMNAPQLRRFLTARPGMMLTRLLRQNPSDEGAVEALYLRVLSREPNRRELQTARRHVGAAKNRAEAYEDLLWALVNSAEFGHRP